MSLPPDTDMDTAADVVADTLAVTAQRRGDDALNVAQSADEATAVGTAAQAGLPAAPEVRYFGIRHHGPGCAHSLRRALTHWQPDCLLIEGPPDADAVLPFVVHTGLLPPVALLIHSTDHPELSAFYPFTSFSPEWQALRYGIGAGIPTRFIDLPQAIRMAQQKVRDDAQQAAAAATISAAGEAADNSKTIAACAIGTGATGQFGINSSPESMLGSASLTQPTAADGLGIPAHDGQTLVGRVSPQGVTRHVVQAEPMSGYASLTRPTAACLAEGSKGNEGGDKLSPNANPVKNSAAAVDDSKTIAACAIRTGATGRNDLKNQSNSAATASEAGQAAETVQAADSASFDDLDPLDALAEAAGFADGESWWNHLVEERGPEGDGLALFEAIAEAMTVLRETWPSAYRGRTDKGRDEEALREAHMRQCVREAQKAGHQRIAVVCGAWHVPALRPAALATVETSGKTRDPVHAKTQKPTEIAVGKGDKAHDKAQKAAEIAASKADKASDKAQKAAGIAADKAEKALARADAALLKGLPRLKVDATWVPWTYQHLTRASGYGAGITAPGWYDFLWHLPPHANRTMGWLSRVARLLREHQIDCSSAHIIEAVRLSDTLAALRGHSAPGLDEMDEAVRSTIFMGDATPLQLIHKALTVSQRMGQVPPEVPAVPLQRDLEQQQKSLRLKPETLERVLELDLRNATDLARSHLLHRLNLLGIRWGRLGAGRSNLGTFRETWSLRWEPELALKIIEASRFGATVASAATGCISDHCQTLESLPALAALVDQVLLADLEAAVHAVSAALQSRAATTGDALQLIAAVPPLARVFRYGSVRQTDSALLAHVLDGLITRGAIGLALACQGLNESAAAALREPLLAAHEAIGLHAQTKASGEQLALWHQALVQIAQGDLPHPLLRGLGCRLLLDGGQWDTAQVAMHLSRQLSAGAPPLEAAHWLDGFLNRNAMVLLHDATVWGLVDAWLEGLTDAHFMQVVPLVRRSFAGFSASARHDLGQRAQRGREALKPAPALDTDCDAERAALPIPLLRLILGVSE